MTRHPDAKAGVNTSKSKYVAIRQAIIEVLDEHGELTFTQLGDAVRRRFEDGSEGSISW